MRKAILVATASIVLMSCGNKTPEAVKLETDLQKVSYAVGSDMSQVLLNAPKNIFDMFDLDAVVKGFEEGFSDSDVNACGETMVQAFGEGFSNPNPSLKGKGSECMGKFSAHDIYAVLKRTEKISTIDKAYLVKGFSDGLHRRDTILSSSDKAFYLSKFQTEIQSILMKEAGDLEQNFLENAKNLPNTQVIEGGIVIQTVKAGTGAKPSKDATVEAHYTLYDINGNKLESSLDRGAPFKSALNGVIAGWKFSFPYLQKGGSYKLFVPANMAYGPEKGPLMFEIEFIDFKN